MSFVRFLHFYHSYLKKIKDEWEIPNHLKFKELGCFEGI